MSSNTIDPDDSFDDGSDAGRESTFEEKYLKAEESALLGAALDAFNVTGPDDEDEEFPPDEDLPEEILSELRGVASGLQVVLNSKTSEQDHYLAHGLKAAATVLVRLLEKANIPAKVHPPDSAIIKIQNEDSVLAGKEAARVWIDAWLIGVRDAIDLEWDSGTGQVKIKQ